MNPEKLNGKLEVSGSVTGVALDDGEQYIELSTYEAIQLHMWLEKWMGELGDEWYKEASNG